MKGSKYLSEMVDISLLKKDKLNIIKAPTGSGKTYFALTHIPNLVSDAKHNVVFLIDTINGKEQILQNYNATSEYYGWAREADENGMWFEDDKNVVILTYAKFGLLSQKYTDFHANFDYIICDELPSLIQFQTFSERPNLHSVALMMLKSAVRNSRTTVIGMSATPRKMKEEFEGYYFELPIDQTDLRHYDVEEIIPIRDFSSLLSGLDPTETGIYYTPRITTMIAVEEEARELGLHPISIWSVGNREHTMTEEQLSVRESILKDYTIPKGYNLLIINSSSETSLKIKSPVDYVIVHSSNEDTQVQVRGRVNNDLKRLYLPASKDDPIELPDRFLGIELFSQDKNELCDYINLKNPYNRPYRWTTIKSLLIDNDYTITEGRRNNLRFAVITKLII